MNCEGRWFKYDIKVIHHKDNSLIGSVISSVARVNQSIPADENKVFIFVLGEIPGESTQNAFGVKYYQYEVATMYKMYCFNHSFKELGINIVGAPKLRTVITMRNSVLRQNKPTVKY